MDLNESVFQRILWKFQNVFLYVILRHGTTDVSSKLLDSNTSTKIKSF